MAIKQHRKQKTVVNEFSELLHRRIHYQAAQSLGRSFNYGEFCSIAKSVSANLDCNENSDSSSEMSEEKVEEAKRPESRLLSNQMIVPLDKSQQVIELKGLQQALIGLYQNRERCIIEFEELVRNLYALNKTVLDKMMINIVLKYHSRSEKVKLLSTSGDYL